MAFDEGLTGAFHGFRLRLLQALVRWVVRPTIIDPAGVIRNGPVFVIQRRSAFDFALLRHILDTETRNETTQSQRVGVESFSLLRPVGWRRRFAMQNFAPEIVAYQEKIVATPSSDISVVPVAIFWGRTAQREKFLWRNMVSERFGPSFAFRRVMTLAFSRKDVLVAFGTPVDWPALTDKEKSLNWNLRRVAIQLRRQFKELRHAALGPDLQRLDTTVERVVDDVSSSLAIDQAGKARSRRSLKRQVRKMATRMSYPVMMLVRGVLSWYFKRVYEDMDLLGREKLQEIAKTHTLIYAPNHRSQTDYLVLSYLLFQHGFAIPQIASGENLDIPVVGPILRRCGAFFMRRSFRDDPIYESVLESYLRLCMEQGNSIEFFIEGGRSRTGLLLPPRFGLLSMILASREKGLTRPVAVVPVYIAYESVPDADAYLDELSGKPKTPETLRDVVLALRLLRSHFGQVSVHIANPIRLDDFVGGGRVKEETERLGYAITHSINKSAVLTPVNLVALVLLATPTHCIDEVSLVQHIASLLRLMRAEIKHNDLVIPGERPSVLIDRCVQLGFVERQLDGVTALITCDQAAAEKLTWFRNNILHVVAIPGLLAAILLNRAAPIEIRELTRFANFLVPFVSQQLSFGSNLRTVRRWIAHLTSSELVQSKGNGTICAAQDLEHRQELRVLAQFVMPMLNRFYIVLTTLLQEGEPMSLNSLVERGRQTSQLLARIQGGEFPTFIDLEFFNRVASTMISQGVAGRTDTGNIHPTDLARTVFEQAQGVFPIDYRQMVERYVAFSGHDKGSHSP